MKTIHQGLISAILVLSGVALGGTWNVDDGHSTARFKIRHLMISNVSGEVTGIKGTFNIDDKDVTKSTMEATLDPKTINTNNTKRDDHLRNSDFLDVPNHATITFKSKKVQKSGKGLRIVGDLTLRGVTKEVTLTSDGFTKEVKDPWGNSRRGFTANTKFSRKDFGVNWSKPMDGGGVVVGDEVDVNIELELVAEKKEEKKS